MNRDDIQRRQAHARAVTITRDDWGIAHVRGKSDADAVFGMIYAQAEDDFNRVETNLLTALGRLAEVRGESAIYQDLRARLFVDPTDLKARYAGSGHWLRELMDAWADGLNYYLAVNPHVKPSAIEFFEPWMALSFVEGGISGDIWQVDVEPLKAFYGKQMVPGTEAQAPSAPSLQQESSGSNAFAIAPANTAANRSLLLINPHPDFYFRSEMHVESGEGLNCYGAVTWGQFFVFQGFNERLGWGHTTSGADNVDEYVETIVEREGKVFYRYGGCERLLKSSDIQIRYRTSEGRVAHRTFTAYYTHRGPVIREVNGRWISIALMYKPIEALTQSFLRMKARNYQEFLKAMDLKANSVVNTVYADADGNIAFLHPQFMPRRDDRFDFTMPVDGSDPTSDWQGEHSLDELPNVLNPPNGWIVNTNNAPYFVAGSGSPCSDDYPRYMDTAGENARGVNATRVLKDRKDFTLASLIDAAYDPYLPAFARLIPSLVAAYDELDASNALKGKLAGQIEMLREWDFRCSVDSVPTSLAACWGEQILRDVEPLADAISSEMGSILKYLLHGRMSATVTYRAVEMVFDWIIQSGSPHLKLNALATASDRLTADFGSWGVPWGEINRYQRLSGDVVPKFDDDQRSAPVALVSGIWGSLAAFKSRRAENTKRWYGLSGNSFLAAVEFGERVRALAIVAGGASGDPSSPHFNDQGARFATGDLRQVYFYPEQLQAHSERTYHPGE